MHKNDPPPPLPNDVPRPIAKLVYSMLAKNPEDRPESARHVADRAEVIREARLRSGNSGPTTSDLPVVPNFPPATSLDLYQGAPERVPDPRNPGNRSFLFAGMGAAAIGVVAIIAVLISSNNNSSLNGVGSNTTLPTQTQSGAAIHKGTSATASQAAGNSVGVNPGDAVAVGAAAGTAPASKTLAPSKSPAKSPTPKKSPTTTPTTTKPTTTKPTTTTPTTTRPTTTKPTTTAPTTTTPTTTTPTTTTPTTTKPTTTKPTTTKPTG
jgi:hypothetical protein